MKKEITFPVGITAKLVEIATINDLTAQRLERAHAFWGEGESDVIMDDGDVFEWQVKFDHSEIERLIANLRTVGEFTEWLSQFQQGGNK